MCRPFNVVLESLDQVTRTSIPTDRQQPVGLSDETSATAVHQITVTPANHIGGLAVVFGERLSRASTVAFIK
jgi:hypothetical protein